MMMRLRLAFVFKLAVGGVVLLTAALSSDASAQQRPPAREGARPSTPRPAPGRADERDANADLSITARVTADSLRFEKVPNPRVEFTGRPERETVWEAERENLPPQVQPGVTYRDVGITLRITSVFADIDRIVAEALGEVPLSDDARPPAPTTERPAAAPASAPRPGTPSASAAASAPRRTPARKGRVN
jgi:hypothetical protein